LTLLCSAPAAASDVTRMPLDHDIHELLASGDGGAWVTIARGFAPDRVGRAQPDGTFRTFAAPLTTAGTVGPDGRAWFASGAGIVRLDAAGAMSTLEIDDVATSLAPAADGSVWALSLYGETITRIAPDDTVTTRRLDVDGCTSALGIDLAHAADGAMWLTGSCGLLRLPPSGPASVVIDAKRVRLSSLAPDATDGVWYTTVEAPGGGHVDARGRRTPLQHNIGRPTDDAVGPDGAAWFATGRCTLARAAAEGSLTWHRAPIPTFRLAFSPGGVWLASPARLVHTTLDAAPGACDDTPPKLRVRPGARKRVSLAALRRGFEISVAEPATLDALVNDAEYPDEPIAEKNKILRHGGTLRVRLPKRELRRLEPGRHVYLLVFGRDGEGNAIDEVRRWRVTR
jgi:hypothetical protein